MISQKPPRKNRRVKMALLCDGFFSFAVVRQIIVYDLKFIKGDVTLSKPKVCVNNERLNCNHNHK